MLRLTLALLLASVQACPTRKHRNTSTQVGTSIATLADAPAATIAPVKKQLAEPSAANGPTSALRSNPSPTPAGTAESVGTEALSQYKRLVAFGDNLSDNGNGSSAHGVAGDPSFIYGFGTWTNGPVAVSYLSDLIGVPLTEDYAFGHADGGSRFGATIDNTFTKSDADAPDAPAQIANYTSSTTFDDSIAETLHFFWFGNNDVLPWLMDPAAHIFFGDSADEGNTEFATELAQRIADNVEALIDAGATKIIVPNVYPRHVAPVVAKYFGLDDASVQQYGEVIQLVNSKLKANLEAFGDKCIYYDAFSFMLDVHNKAVNGGYDGIVHMTPGADICDGATGEAVPGISNWELCQVQHRADEFYWMQFIDPTTHVHRLVAEDMAKVVQAAMG